MITRLLRARSLRACVLAFVPSIFSSLAVAAPQYTITSFATFDSSEFQDLNDQGVAVGFYSNDAGGFSAFQSDGVTATTLTPLVVGKNAFAFGINNSGTAVGDAKNSSVPSQTRSVTFGSPTVELIPGSAFSAARAINDAGQVAGGFGNSSSTSHAFLKTSGSVQDLGVLAGQSQSFGTAINSAGQVAGFGTSSTSSTTRGFIWTSGVGMTNLGLPTGETSAAIAGVEAINDSGWITGQWQRYVGGVSQNRRSFVWRDGVMEDITPGFVTTGFADAFDINNLGQIVGEAAALQSQIPVAFLWDNGTAYKLTDLIDPSLGWVLDSASAINELGQIVGAGRLNGVSGYYLLNPVAAPVPAAVWLFGSGLLGLVAMARRRRT